MGGPGKASKVSSVVAAVCIFIYVIAIAFGAVEIIESIGERKNLAEKEFYDLTDLASSSAVVQHFMGEEYLETLQDYVSRSETLRGVIITAGNGEFAFELYRGSGIVWADNTPRLKMGPGLFNMHLPLMVEGQRNVTIQAVCSSIESNTLLRVLRNTLLAVLAALAIALVTLLIELARKNKYRTVYAEKPVNDASASAKTPGKREADIIRRPDFGAVAWKEAESAVQLKNEEDFPTELTPLKEDTDAPFGDIEFPEEDISESTTETVLSKAPEIQNPQGLYTPRGNIGWESYTIDRLNSELHRCASFEQDLVFFAIEYKTDGESNDSLYRQVADEAVNFFVMRDLIFESGERGLSVIVPSIDLEHGIAKSEEFRSRIIAKQTESLIGENVAQKFQLCIGLSSRSGRIIDAERLILEASKALEKALDDPASPIIGFKSDPEKYRKFIKGRS